MPGLVPGIHVFTARKEVVDGRDEPGHDKELDFLSALLILFLHPGSLRASS